MLSIEISRASDFVYVALTIFLISVSSYLLQLHSQLTASGKIERINEYSLRLDLAAL